MRLLGLLAAGGILAAAATPTPAVAAPVTFSGTVSYTGPYTADTLYAAVVDTAGPTAFGFFAVPAGSPPFSRPYSVAFDNSLTVRPLLMAVLLDVDGSGFDPDSLEDVVTNADLLGWYAGQAAPTFVDPSTSQSGLDFDLPTAEIRGEVVFESGQAWADIQAFALPDEWSPLTFGATASGPYALLGLYAGDFAVTAWGGSFGRICYGDPTCVSPTIVTLVDGEIRTGVDLDFRPSAVESQTWSRLKALWR
jgi:hypothetical protein